MLTVSCDLSCCNLVWANEQGVVRHRAGKFLAKTVHCGNAVKCKKKISGEAKTRTKMCEKKCSATNPKCTKRTANVKPETRRDAILKNHLTQGNVGVRSWQVQLMLLNVECTVSSLSTICALGECSLSRSPCQCEHFASTCRIQKEGKT